MLTSLLKKDAVPFETLHARYGGLLELVRTLIGVVPNCDPYLEIWPPAFRTYNVVVPNFLNLPFLIWGAGAPRDVLGLALYASSREAGCAYCSAHTCSFALRRGADADHVARAFGKALDGLSRAERAAIAAARALSAVPATFTAAHRAELEAALPGADAEWIALGVAMMGFLNKTMDALGVELEGSTVEEVRDVITPSGWSPGQHTDGGAGASRPAPEIDGLRTKLGVVRHAPGAIALDKKWTRGAPDRGPAARAWLRERTGHDFPVLERMTRRRAVRAFATMLRDNLDEEASVVGVSQKLAAGAIFTRAVESETLEAQLAKSARPRAIRASRRSRARSHRAPRAWTTPSSKRAAISRPPRSSRPSASCRCCSSGTASRPSTPCDARCAGPARVRKFRAMEPSIDKAVWDVLAEYDERRTRERERMKKATEDGTFASIIDELLLPVGPESGRLLNILVKSLDAPKILELGTSYGYSGIWLGEAARAKGGRVITMELSQEKSAYARERSKRAGLADFVEFRVGDAVKMIGEVSHGFDFVLVDLWKDLYVPCLEAFYPKLNKGAIIVADNMIEPRHEREAILAYQRAVRAKPKITSVMVPVGSGLEISRFDEA
ncbi:MAG TPA: DUF1442 domain-containing protein [Labilithrix sp.]